MLVRKRIAGALLLVAMAAGVAAFAQDRNRENAAADVREAVVRYQIRTWYIAVDSYCISVNRKNANKTFLERLAPLPVKEASDCVEDRRRVGRTRLPSWVANKQTGQPSVVFYVGAIRWLSDDAVEVKGGYYCAARCWAGGTYQVIREEDRWTVTDFDIVEISSARE